MGRTYDFQSYKPGSSPGAATKFLKPGIVGFIRKDLYVQLGEGHDPSPLYRGETMAYFTKEVAQAHYRHVADYRRLVVNRWKRRKGCVDCGYRASYDALELDHLPGKKGVYTVASMMYRSWKRIKEEIAKCEVVCANCHAIRTRQREKV